MLKTKVVFFLLVAVVTGCGKHTKTTGKVNSNVNRLIDAVTEGNFTPAEATLGNQFCAALNYRRTNFGNMYAAGQFPKKFVFEMNQKTCDVENPATFNQTLLYSTNNGFNYISGGAPGVIPFLETNTSGVFATYCANQNQNSRVYNLGSEVKVYRFFPGDQCGGLNTQICAVYERAATTDFITTNYKRIVIANGAFLNLDLKGQEVFSEEQSSCGGKIQMLKHILREVQN